MILAIMVGGALGALCRYAIGLGMQLFFANKLVFPWATFGINIVGSFVLAFLFFANYWHLPNTWRVAIGTGFLGAFTTFSTFELETLRLFESGKTLLAILYILASVLLGLLAALLGRFFALRLG
jgi:fluoride exporter